MAIKTRMPGLRSECVQLYWNIWCLNVPMFSGRGTEYRKVGQRKPCHHCLWGHPGCGASTPAPFAQQSSHTAQGRSDFKGHSKHLARLTETQVQGLMSRSSDSSSLK